MDLILINDFDKTINSEFLLSCFDIMNNNGDIWIMLPKTNDILDGDANTKLLQDILHETNIRYYKNSVFDDYVPLDIIIINKSKNKSLVRARRNTC